MRRGAQALSDGARVIDAQLDAGFGSGSGFRAAFAKMLGQSPSSFHGDEALKADWIDTPIGGMIAVADRESLRLLEFVERSILSRELEALRKESGSTIGVGRFPAIDNIERELAAYFDGTLQKFRTPLSPVGSPFSEHIWRTLRQIPLGHTRSYAAIAEAIGRPNTVRAVARATGANPIAIVIPCHRVIGADGRLTGYGGGLWRKSWLIEHERTVAATVC